MNRSDAIDPIHGYRGHLVNQYDSDFVSWFEAIIVMLIFLFYRILLKIRDPLIPPGPMPLPFFGNILQLGDRPYLDLRRMAKQYGSIFSIYLGPRLVIVVNTMASAREALSLSNKSLSNRPYFYTSKGLTLGPCSIRYSNYSKKIILLREIFAAAGEQSKVSQMKDIEKAVCAEVARLNLYIDEQIGHPIYLDVLIWKLAVSLTSQTMLGIGYNYDDPDLRCLIQAQKLEAEALATHAPVDFYPALFHRFPCSKMKKLQEANSIKLPIIKRMINECTRIFVPGTARTITENILQARYDIQQGNIKGIKNFTNEDLYCYVNEAFGLGAETIVSALCWNILYLVRHKDIQQKMYDEIQKLVGNRRPPCLNDRQYLHYTQAVITEGLRLGLPAKLGIPREASQNTTLGGYRVPRGTMIVFNLWAINTDETYWDDPLEFLPSRYSNDNGEYVGDLASVAFGRGQRACAGENIAKAQLFLLLAQLVYFYRFEYAPGEDMPTIHSTTGHFSHPLPFKVLITHR